MMSGMKTPTYQERQALLHADQTQLAEHQRCRLNMLLEQILPANAFYEGKLQRATTPLVSLDQLNQLPFTYKEELVEGAIDSTFAANLTYPVNHYVKMHRTSGTRGKPLVVLDTAEDWKWWMTAWDYVLDAAALTDHDRVVMAFSFGPLYRILECL